MKLINHLQVANTRILLQISLFTYLLLENVIEHLRVCAVHIHSIKASPQTYISVCIYETFNTQNIKENRAHRVTTKGLLYILIIHTNSVHFEDDTIKIGFFIKFIFYSHMSNSIPHRSLILPPGIIY